MIGVVLAAAIIACNANPAPADKEETKYAEYYQKVWFIGYLNNTRFDWISSQNSHSCAGQTSHPLSHAHQDSGEGGARAA